MRNCEVDASTREYSTNCVLFEPQLSPSGGADHSQITSDNSKTESAAGDVNVGSAVRSLGTHHVNVVFVLAEHMSSVQAAKEIVV